MRRASSCAAATASCDFKVSLLKSKSFSSVLPRRDRPRRLVEHEVAPVLLVHVLDLFAHLALEPFDARVGAAQLIFESQDDFDAREVEAEFSGQPLDQAQAATKIARIRPSIGRSHRAPAATSTT